MTPYSCVQNIDSKGVRYILISLTDFHLNKDVVFLGRDRVFAESITEDVLDDKLDVLRTTGPTKLSKVR